MFQGVRKKFFIDALNHAIPNDEHWFRFLGLVRFWDRGGDLSFLIRGSIFFIHYMAHLIYFEDVTSVLVILVVSSECAWIALSICTSFTLLFCFTNFVNWRLLSDWMEFEVVDIQVLRRYFFQQFCWVSGFNIGCYFCIHRSCVWAVF